MGDQLLRGRVEPEVPERESDALGLRHYLDVVRRRKWLVLGVLAVAVGAAAAVSLLTPPTYQATMKLVVGQEGGLPQVQFGREVQTFTATMADLVRSNVVAERVIDELELRDETAKELLERMSVSINPETAVVKVSVEDHDRERAVEIARTVGSVFAGLVRERFVVPEASDSTESVPPVTVTIFDPAHAEPDPVAPRPVRNVALALALGLVLGFLAAFVRDHFDRAVRSRETVEQLLGVPVIASVPFERTDPRRQRITWSGAMAEAMRGLRANLQYLSIRRPVRTLLITSAGSAQGKTTVTANLAAAIARSGASVVAVEGDLRRPRLEVLIGHEGRRAGLTNVLVGTAHLSEALVEVEVPAEGGLAADVGRFAFLPGGPQPPNPTELLSSPPMRSLLEELSQRFDYVLIDSPPMLPIADALELARLVDGMLVIVRRNATTTDEAREVRGIVDRLGLRLLGAVFTDVGAPGAYGYGSYQATRREAARPAPVGVGDDV